MVLLQRRPYSAQPAHEKDAKVDGDDGDKPAGKLSVGQSLENMQPAETYGLLKLQCKYPKSIACRFALFCFVCTQSEWSCSGSFTSF